MMNKLGLAASAFSLVAASAAAWAQVDPDEAAPAVKSPSALPVSEEYLLLGSATRGAGEPMNAVDPTNPNNIVAVAMGNIQQIGGKAATANSTELYHSIP